MRVAPCCPTTTYTGPDLLFNFQLSLWLKMQALSACPVITLRTRVQGVRGPGPVPVPHLPLSLLSLSKNPASFVLFAGQLIYIKYIWVCLRSCTCLGLVSLIAGRHALQDSTSNPHIALAAIITAGLLVRTTTTTRCFVTQASIRFPP